MGGTEVTYLLDTNVWLWSANKRSSLPPAELALLSDSDATFGLSIMSIWEVAKKHQIGKLPLSAPFGEWFRRALTPNITIIQLTPEIITDAMKLPSFPNHDPADELIVATAVAHGLTLITSDKMLRGYKHARVHYFKPLI